MGYRHVFLIFFLAMASEKMGVAASDASRAIGRSSQLFSSKLYKEVANTKTGNILICPISLQTVLALVYVGAEGETSNQMQTALNFPADKSTITSGFNDLIQTFNSAKDVELDIANRVYVKDGFEISKNFQEVAVKNFDAAIENVDFADSVRSAKHINKWVEKKTHDKIKDIVQPEDINSDTRLVLVNALYFKGTWKQQFALYATHEQDFYLNERDTVKVQMMHQTSFFRYAENAELDCKFLEMDYDGNEITMTIVLPNSKTGLPALEAKLDKVLEPQSYSTLNVDVSLPRFKIEETVPLNDILKALGMQRAFENNSQITGLSHTGEPLKISKVLQKNFINVTEEGTEAASATVVHMKKVKCALEVLEVEKVIKFDHPFLYYARKLGHDVIILVGTVTKPPA